MANEESNLVAAAVAGDPGALAELLREHEGRVYRFGRRLCGDPEDAREVLQDTLLAAARHIKGFRGEASFSTWLFTLARSACIKRRRTSKGAPTHHAPLDEAVAIADASPGPEHDLATREMLGALDRAIDALEPGSREVLLLRDGEGLTAPEVARVLGISVDAVKSRLHRARTAVRARLEPLLLPGAVAEAALPGDCPDVVALLSRHLEGDIDADTCARMERHLEGCPRCRGACDALRETLALCRRAGSAPVPPAVQSRVRAALRDVIRLGE